MRSIGVAIVLGIGFALFIACGGQQLPNPGWEDRLHKANEITALWTQLREFRRQAHMPLDPAPQQVPQWLNRPIQEAAKVCPEGHTVPTTCNDVCNLSDDICDNAERICVIADELGKSDDWAQEKCASAKASCREAKQKCCSCSGGAP
jgi:hypothetical protein